MLLPLINVHAQGLRLTQEIIPIQFNGGNLNWVGLWGGLWVLEGMFFSVAVPITSDKMVNGKNYSIFVEWTVTRVFPRIRVPTLIPN